MPLTVTTLFVAAFSVALVALCIPVTIRQIKVGEAICTYLDPALDRLIRAQGKFVEFVPLTLLGLALVEFTTQSSVAPWVIGSVLAAGRLLHAASILCGWRPEKGAA